MLSSAMRNIVASDGIHLLYHSFTGTPIPHITPLYSCKSAGDLERDLVYLKNGFRVIRHAELVALRESGGRIPSNIASVNFDDGLIECFTVARPLLLAHKIPATFFVCSSFVDNRALMHRNKIALCVSRIGMATPAEFSNFKVMLRARFGVAAASLYEIEKWLFSLDFTCRETIDAACECLGIDVSAFLQTRRPYMSREQIAELHAEGFTIGAHTSDHPELGKLQKWDEVRYQIRSSCEFVREITGQSRVPFAFPFNGASLSHAELAALRQEFGIDLVYDTNNVTKGGFIVNRICCDTPNGGTSSCSNLPRLLRRARVVELLRLFKRCAHARSGYQFSFARQPEKA